MTDLVKSLAPSIWSEIQSAQKILFCCHPSPDPDSIGSNLAFSLALEAIGKQTTVLAGDSELPKSVSHLPGVDRIVPRNFLQADLSQYDLFIALDASGLEQITKEGPINFPSSLSVVVIDHHHTNNSFGRVNLVDTAYISVGEIVYDLFSLWNIPTTSDIAANLYLAMYTDSGGFKYEKTTPATYEIASKLIKIYPDFSQLVFKYENQNDPERIYYEGLALTSVKLFFNNQVAISLIEYPQLNKLGIRKVHTDKSEIANALKSVIGWQIGISFVEKVPRIVSLSFRTRDPVNFDVCRIAQATKFGGGHPAAAGATLKMPFDEALKYLLDTIASVYPQLGTP